MSFWAFLSQVLSPDGSCRMAVRKALAYLFSSQGLVASSNTSAYCQARSRLPEPLLRRTLTRVSRSLEARCSPQDLWHGHPVRIVDGTGVSMPDTPANQALYPQPKGQKPGCGFPVMRLVAVFSLATGAILSAATGSLHVHESALLRRLGRLFRPGDVALGDRAFGGFLNIAWLYARRVDAVFRLHQRRKADFKTGQRLGFRDHVVQWTKPVRRPKGVSPSLFRSLPDTLLVRQVEIRVRRPGFRTRRILLATTLLDPQRYPKSALADLYLRRWRAELFLRDIKTTLGADVLRGQSPAMVRRELWMHLIAYNLVRSLMLRAARLHHADPSRLSFKGTLDTLRTWAPVLAQATGTPNQLDALLDAMLLYIATDPVPHRPHRIEPRARKRRPKNYPLLTRPRNQFVEIPHRNMYKKVLS